MPESTELTTKPASPVPRLAERLGERLGVLGLSVSVWDPTGAELSAATGCGDLCGLLCKDPGMRQKAMGRLAQEVCLEGATRVSTGPAGCCLLAVPVRRRRKVVAAVVAGFPPHQMAESEELARASSQARLDLEVTAGLCRRVARHDAEHAKILCKVVEWLVDDAQAEDVAQTELAILSANLASTYEELSLLYRISGSMKVTVSGPDFFDNLCRELLEVMELQAAAVLLHPREHGSGTDQVVVAGEMPLNTEQVAQIVRKYLSPRLRSNKRAVVENDFATHAAHLGPEVAPIRRLIAVPLMIADRCKGVLMGFNKLTGEFDSVDLKLISSISGQAAAFLENHHLYEDLQDLLMGLLHALTASIDAKDKYTCGHSRRVALMSRKLAALSGFEPERVERVYLAGLLHDIGKIGVPESVLLKMGKLTDEEYDKVKRHPEIGAGILKGITQMEDALPVVLYHHERPDGRGYPRGLAGRDIPIEALIVGLADSLDAMSSNRTYRDAMSLEAVLAEIRRCSGTQFDSHLVELLLSLDLEKCLNELREATAPDAEAPCGAER